VAWSSSPTPGESWLEGRCPGNQIPGILLQGSDIITGRRSMQNVYVFDWKTTECTSRVTQMQGRGEGLLPSGKGTHATSDEVRALSLSPVGMTQGGTRIQLSEQSQPEALQCTTTPRSLDASTSCG